MVRIEVYIDIEKGVVRGNNPYGPSPWSVRRRLGSLEGNLGVVGTSFSDMAPGEKGMMDAVLEFAEGHGVEYKVHDVSKFGSWLGARLHGIRRFPAVRLGKHTFVGKVSQAELAAAYGKS